MKRKIATTSSLLFYQTLQFSFLNPKLTKVSSLFSYLTSKLYCFSTFTEPSSTSLPLLHPIPLPTKTHLDLSSINFNGIAQSLLSKCSNLYDVNECTSESAFNNNSLKNLLLDVSDVIPHVTRRLRRVSSLKPEDLLELFEGFQFEYERVEINRVKVVSLWRIFKGVSEHDKGFKHHPRSCEVMAFLLIRYRFLREVQLLLVAMEKQGISMSCNEIFGGLVEGYAAIGDLERAALVYDQMREQGLVLSHLRYRMLIDLLVSMKRTQLAFRVSLDMVELGLDFSDGEKFSIENVVRLLCEDGMILEARNLVKNIVALGFRPSNLVLNDIACGYCEKKDFDDLLTFLNETKCLPNNLTGQKIIFSLCRNYGTEKANIYRLELERLGFKPDAVTFGILIGWCCKEGNLRGALIYFAEILSGGLKPEIWSYNALIGAMFKNDMCSYVQDILDEMIDRKTNPNLSTFRILLAGYCKARKFDEAKLIVHEMINHGLIESSSLDDLLSKAFVVLGLDSLSVKLKRDNYVGLSKTEFFDKLGNGLYLETDVDQYDKKLTEILDDSSFPNFDLLLRKECDAGIYKEADLYIGEMIQWCQEPSLSVISDLVKSLCGSHSRFKALKALMTKLPNFVSQLDHEVLSLLVQAYCRYGLVDKGRILFNKMLLMDLPIKNETYTALMIGLCKKGNLHDLHVCWDMAKKRNWLPELGDLKPVIQCLCDRGMLKEALDFLESILMSYPRSRSEIFSIFIEKFSVHGFTSISQMLAEKLMQKSCFLDGTAHTRLLSGLCKERKYVDAFKMLDMMMVRNLVPSIDVSLVLIPLLCRAGRLEKAIGLKETCCAKQPSSSSSIYGALIKGLCQTGMVGEAENVIQDMLSKGLEPGVEDYSMLLQSYCLSKNTAKVRKLLGILMRKYSSLSISNYRNCVRLMCSENDVTGSLKMKDLMLTESKSHSLVVFNTLLFYLLSSGNASLAIKVLNEIQEKRVILNEVTYNFLVYGFSKCKDMSCWHHVLTMIPQGYTPSYRSLSSVMIFLCEVGENSKALELSHQMELRGWVHGSIVQNLIVEFLISDGKLQEAEHFLDRLADMNLIPGTVNYDNLIKRFCQLGRLSKAIDLVNVMLKKGNVPNCTSYDSVIHGLCTSNQLNQAMEFHNEMLDRGLRPSTSTWDVLIHKFCEHGPTTEAEKLLLSMVEAGDKPTRLMYSSVIDRYRFENNPKKASELMQRMQKSGYKPDFNTHWSLISNLSASNDDEKSSSSEGFLSRLLRGSGHIS